MKIIFLLLIIFKVALGLNLSSPVALLESKGVYSRQNENFYFFAGRNATVSSFGTNNVLSLDRDSVWQQPPGDNGIDFPVLTGHSADEVPSLNGVIILFGVHSYWPISYATPYVMFFNLTTLVSETWNTTGTTLPTERYGHATAKGTHKRDGLIYVYGGINSLDNPVRDVWQFNYTSRSWKVLQDDGNVPNAAQHPVSAGVGMVYVPSCDCLLMCMGANSSEDEPSNDCSVFELETNTWSLSRVALKGNVPLPRSSGAMLLSGGDQASFVGGGNLNTKTFYSDIYTFDLTKLPLAVTCTQIFTRDASDTNAPFPRMAHAVVPVNDYWFVYGGFGGTLGNETDSKLYIYNSSSQAWTDQMPDFESAPVANLPSSNTGSTSEKTTSIIVISTIVAVAAILSALIALFLARRKKKPFLPLFKKKDESSREQFAKQTPPKLEPVPVPQLAKRVSRGSIDSACASSVRTSIQLLSAPLPVYHHANGDHHQTLTLSLPPKSAHLTHHSYGTLKRLNRYFTQIKRHASTTHKYIYNAEQTTDSPSGSHLLANQIAVPQPESPLVQSPLSPFSAVDSLDDDAMSIHPSVPVTSMVSSFDYNPQQKKSLIFSVVNN